MSTWTDRILLISGYCENGPGGNGPGGLFAYDGAELSVVDTVSCMGLNVGPDWVGRLLRSAPEDPTELLVYDQAGVLEYRRVDAVEDPHDLLRLSDGAWLIVSSNRNAVFRLGADGGITIVWQPSEVPDSWHPNCLTVVDGDIWATAFGAFAEHRGWQDDAGHGAGILRNLSTGEEYGGLSHPHSPRYVNGDWFVCNSLAGSVVTWDPIAARWDDVVGSLVYPRGLAVRDDVLYVGQSGERGNPDDRGALTVVEEGVVVDTIPLPCAEVYDVVWAPAQVSAGLRRGFDTNSVRVSTSALGLLDSVGSVHLAAAMAAPLDQVSTAIRVDCQPPLRLARSESVPLKVELHNAGSTTLVTAPPHPVYVSYRWIAPSGARTDGPRSPLGRILAPGNVASLELALIAPDTPGRYGLSIAPLEEGVVWLDDVDRSNGFHATVDVV